MQPRTGSGRAAALAARLEEAASSLIAVIEPIDDDRWRLVSEPGVWSISKDVEHVAEASAYHQWIVRLTIGDKVLTQASVPFSGVGSLTGMFRQARARLVHNRFVRHNAI